MPEFDTTDKVIDLRWCYSAVHALRLRIEGSVSMHCGNLYQHHAALLSCEATGREHGSTMQMAATQRFKKHHTNGVNNLHDRLRSVARWSCVHRPCDTDAVHALSRAARIHLCATPHGLAVVPNGVPLMDHVQAVVAQLTSNVQSSACSRRIDVTHGQPLTQGTCFWGSTGGRQNIVCNDYSCFPVSLSLSANLKLTRVNHAPFGCC